MRYLPDHIKTLSNLREGQSSQGQFPVYAVRTVTGSHCQDSGPWFIEPKGVCKGGSDGSSGTVYCGIWAKQAQYIVRSVPSGGRGRRFKSSHFDQLKQWVILYSGFVKYLYPTQSPLKLIKKPSFILVLLCLGEKLQPLSFKS